MNTPQKELQSAQFCALVTEIKTQSDQHNSHFLSDNIETSVRSKIMKTRCSSFLLSIYEKCKSERVFIVGTMLVQHDTLEDAEEVVCLPEGRLPVPPAAL